MSRAVWRRAERLAALAKQLSDHPGRLLGLAELGESFGAAKSSISEDLRILRELFAERGYGCIETVPGAAGGVRYRPDLPASRRAQVVEALCRELASPGRVLSGGFLYMSDLISSPTLGREVGTLFAGRFAGERVDVVLTIETSGIPLAVATAQAIGVPLAIARRVTRPSDGTVVSMNYVSGTSRRVETMSLPRRALDRGARVLIVDDFMKGGGTARGLVDLAAEFEASVAGIGVLIETAQPVEKRVRNYVSLCVLDAVEEEPPHVAVRPGSLR
ncbi:MAG TPA: pur operon repressor [Limnochordia bacterium]|nr:pur operon repressor [Limnochordia bacterium]